MTIADLEPTDYDSIPEEQTKKDYSEFDNYSKKRVTLIGYLLGVRSDKLESTPFNQKYLNELKTNEDMNIIRALCSLRQGFLYNYDKIYKEKQVNGPFTQLDKMDNWLDIESYNYLKSKGIEAFEACVDIKEFTKHIANINQLIEENIDKIYQYIPEWLEWKYIRDLFVMPNAAAGHKGSNYANKKKGKQISDTIHACRKDFFDHMYFYPFQTYMNWNPKKRGEDCGNILFNDSKFLKILYGSHYDTFKGEQYVIDAKNEVKNSIYDFIEQATNVAIFVDCENIDPYKFAAVFKNLDDKKISKIKKIVLYNDLHTSNAWDILQDIIDITIEYELVERIKDEKSLVDHALSIGVTKAVYKDSTDSVIIASSDSDFWSLIKYLPDTKFFVMNETRQTAQAVLTKLDDYKVPHCFMDDFAQDKIQPYKNKVLKKNLQTYIDEFNERGTFAILDVDELIEDIFRKSGIDVPYRQLEKEKTDFFNKYVKRIKLVIEEEDETRKFQLKIDT